MPTPIAYLLLIDWWIMLGVASWIVWARLTDRV